MEDTAIAREAWPSLPLDAWKDTYATLHLWTQIVGKVRLKLSPFVNHWWEAALYVTPRGLTTSPVPCGDRCFEIAFDFTDDVLEIVADDGRKRAMALGPRSVADFYEELMAILGHLGFHVAIDPEPKEIADPVPFDRDRTHASYDEDAVGRWFKLLLHADRILKEFRSGFIGKCSPVHFFWGSFDLAVTRFSGRRAPPRPNADHITRVAYSHEVSSVGFWPGSANVFEAAFYAYAAPPPPKFEAARVEPREAFWNPPTSGFVLKCADVARAPDPDAAVLAFARSTYDAAADLGEWDRASLERRRAKAA